MVFGFFKKKKPPQKTQAPGQSTTTTVDPKSSLKSQETSKSKDKTKKSSEHHQEPIEDEWMYETMVQFLASPSWQIPIITYVDDNCIIFDEDEEENQSERLEVHEGFKKLLKGLLDDVLNELEISEEKMAQIIQIGLKHPQDKKLFEQLLVMESYPVFKNLMVKRNKQLELEAMEQLHELDKKKSGTKTKSMELVDKEDLERLTLEKEQAEIEHALALSLALEQERRTLQDQEEYEIQEALKQSQIEYDKFQQAEKEKERETEREKERIRLEEIEKQKIIEKEALEAELKAKESESQAKETESHEKETEVSHQSLEHLEEQKVDLTASKVAKGKKLEPLTNAPKLSGSQVLKEERDPTRSGFLPPLRANTKFEPMTFDELLNEKDRIDSEIQQKKQESSTKTESLEERKKRLKAQRDLLLAKKKAEREAELKKYEAKKEAPVHVTQEKSGEYGLTEAEIQKRKAIYQKLKSEL